MRLSQELKNFITLQMKTIHGQKVDIVLFDAEIMQAYGKMLLEQTGYLNRKDDNTSTS